MVSNDYTYQQSKCPVCNRTDIKVFLEIPQMPIHCNVLWLTRAEAIGAPRGDMQLGFCRCCGHIFNLAFKPELMDYTPAYENSLHFSPRFQNYAESLAGYLIDRYDLHNKDIIEIGCGKGDFLRLICQPGGNRGIGFDPGYTPVPNSDRKISEQISFIPDFFTERYADYKADLVCCRHVLEHIQFPRDFLNTVYQSIRNKPKAIVFFEVPNALFMLRELGIWDLIYEHCSYFSSISLSYLFTLYGFDICELNETYDGQYLTIEAMPGESPANSRNDFGDDLEELITNIATFADSYQRKIGVWQCNLGTISEAGQRTVVWGGGAKGVTFLNMLKTQQQIEYVVDINPRKQGKYIAGTGQQIIAPVFLQDYQPDVVIVMNAIYQAEIQQIMEELGLSCDIIVA